MANFLGKRQIESAKSTRCIAKLAVVRIGQNFQNEVAVERSTLAEFAAYQLSSLT